MLAIYGRADPSGSHAWQAERLSAEDDPHLQGLLSEPISATFDKLNTETPTLTLRQAVAGPLSKSLDLTRVVQLYVYRPHDMDEILAFDARITDRYSTFWAQHGEFYGGTFHCEEFGSNWLVEVAAFAADEAEAANALVADVEPPADVAEIIRECKALQNREKPRYLVWLLPQEVQR